MGKTINREDIEKMPIMIPIFPSSISIDFRNTGRKAMIIQLINRRRKEHIKKGSINLKLFIF
jgi:hypothetical protein